MPSSSPSENPFIAINQTFTRAYAGDAGPTITIVGSSETIVGGQEDGGMLSLTRADVRLKEAQGIFRVRDALPMGEEDIPESDDGIDELTAEYLVGGSEERPVALEVISQNPLMTRELSDAEKTELARKIGSTTFY